jgi:hypothetical protein
MSGKAPAGWIGNQVGLRYWNGEQRTYLSCELRAVSDRGIIVGWGEGDDETNRFYPWQAVLHIELLKERATQPATSSSDPSGFGSF